MPIPQPRDGEKEDEFIPRCMGDKVMNEDYPDSKQRAAVCYSQWREKHGGKEAKSVGQKMAITAFFDLEGGK